MRNLSIFTKFILVMTLGSLYQCSPEKQEHRTSQSKEQLVGIPYSVFVQEQSALRGFYPDHGRTPHYAIGYLNEDAMDELPDRLKKAIVTLNEKLWARGAYDRDSLELLNADATQDMEAGYHNYQALTAAMKTFADTHPELVRLETAGKSVQGRELWYVVLSDNPTIDEDEPKLFFHANMHGDEVVGRELMLYLIEHMLSSYGKDERITQLLTHAQIFIMPSMNPDGFELRQRANAKGYDLNRNFPDRFTSPQDTPNGRQIEVQHVMKLAADNHFVFGMNWHGGEICFNLPWGNIKNDRPENMYWDDAMFNPIGREYTKFNKPMYANHHANFDHGLTYGYEWYPVNGGTNDWMNYYRRSVFAVVELSVVKWPNASELQKFWDDNREAMITYLWRGMRGVHLDIRSPENMVVAKPEITTGTSDRLRTMTFDDGMVDRLTGDGLQRLTIRVDGFAPKVIETQATYFNGERVRVDLERL